MAQGSNGEQVPTLNPPPPTRRTTFRYNGSDWKFETYTWYEFNVTRAVPTAALNAHLNGGAGNVSFALLTSSGVRTSVRQLDNR